jgi:hypothetical protein
MIGLPRRTRAPSDSQAEDQQSNVLLHVQISFSKYISETSPNRKAQGPKNPKASRHRDDISREDLHGKEKKREKRDSR